MKAFTKLLIVGVIGAAFVAFQWSGPTFDPESLKGARVLVTGASAGIGEQMAYHLAGFGAQVVITARREKVLQQWVVKTAQYIYSKRCLRKSCILIMDPTHPSHELFTLLPSGRRSEHEVAEKCQVLGPQKALYIAADMANPSDPERVVKFAVDKLGGLDYLVLNHIGPSPFTMWDGDVEHTRWLMQVNFLSYLQMAKTALPTLKQSKGSIVVVSSLLGKMSSPFVAPYTSTKFALNGFFGTLQHELAMQRSNVSITICILGLIDTDSAMEKVRGITNIQAWPASEAALHIITSGATQQTESYYPWFCYYVCLIRDWFPYFRDMSLRNLYKY